MSVMMLPQAPRLEEVVAPPGDRRAAHGERGPAGGERRAARVGPRAGSPPGPDFGQFVASALVGSTSSRCKAPSATDGPEARRAARTPRGLPGPAADRGSARA